MANTNFANGSEFFIGLWRFWSVLIHSIILTSISYHSSYFHSCFVFLSTISINFIFAIHVTSNKSYKMAIRAGTKKYLSYNQTIRLNKNEFIFSYELWKPMDVVFASFLYRVMFVDKICHWSCRCIEYKWSALSVLK